MTLLRGGAMLLAVNLRSALFRVSSSLVIVVAFAVAVLVFLSIFGMAQAFRSTIDNTGSVQRLILLKQGALSEIASSLTMQDVDTVRSLTDSALSAELVTMVKLARSEQDSWVVALRGLADSQGAIRPALSIAEGRLFTPGRYELMVGAQLAAEQPSLRVGAQVPMRGRPWDVVGIFESGGDAHESELLTDLTTLQSAIGRRSVSSIRMSTENGANSKEAVTARLATDQRLAVTVEGERDYYKRQSGRLSTVMFFLAYGIGAVMALGALFGALNAIYSAVEMRRAEIGTLKAIGARPTAIALAFVAESTVLAMAGAALGVVLGWLVFNGATFSTIGESFHLTQLVFQVRLPAEILLLCIATACVIGAIGGLIPAVRAASVSPIVALRAS